MLGLILAPAPAALFCVFVVLAFVRNSTGRQWGISVTAGLISSIILAGAKSRMEDSRHRQDVRVTALPAAPEVVQPIVPPAVDNGLISSAGLVRAKDSIRQPPGTLGQPSGQTDASSTGLKVAPRTVIPIVLALDGDVVPLRQGLTRRLSLPFEDETNQDVVVQRKLVVSLSTDDLEELYGQPRVAITLNWRVLDMTRRTVTESGSISRLTVNGLSRSAAITRGVSMAVDTLVDRLGTAGLIHE